MGMQINYNFLLSLEEATNFIDMLKDSTLILEASLITSINTREEKEAIIRVISYQKKIIEKIFKTAIIKR